MVNYKRVVCQVAMLLATLSIVATAPTFEGPERHYDQRQNGTENYRLNIDGVVIAVAPAEALLSAASDLDISDFLEIEDFSDFYKPKPPAASPPKPNESKPEDLPPKPEIASPKPSESPSDATSTLSVKGNKKDASERKQEKANRLKQRLAGLLLPLLRKTRHH